MIDNNNYHWLCVPSNRSIVSLLWDHFVVFFRIVIRGFVLLRIKMYLSLKKPIPLGVIEIN